MSILVAHSLASLLVLLISPCLCLIRRAKILLPQAGLTSGITAASDLPVHQPQRIDVSTFKGVKVAHVDTLIQHLRSHVPETHTHTPNSSATNTSSAYYNTWWYLADFLFKCGVCVPLGAHTLVGGDVYCICDRLMAYCEAQISDGTREILLYQNVL